MSEYTIEKCYLLIRKNCLRNEVSYDLSDFYLSLGDLYNTISQITRIEFTLLDDLNELLEVVCVKLIVENDRIKSMVEMRRLSLKEVDSLLIPF